MLLLQTEATIQGNFCQSFSTQSCENPVMRFFVGFMVIYVCLLFYMPKYPFNKYYMCFAQLATSLYMIWRIGFHYLGYDVMGQLCHWEKSQINQNFFGWVWVTLYEETLAFDHQWSSNNICVEKIIWFSWQHSCLHILKIIIVVRSYG